MNGSIVRGEQHTRGWRMRPWPHDPTVAHLIFVDHLAVPSREAFEAACAHAARRGARAIRTSALFPDAAAVAADAGFRAIDRLALLGFDLTETARLPQQRLRTQPLRPWHHREAARIDTAAFGPVWGNDAAGLRDIRRATPHFRARVVRLDGAVAGTAFSGGAAANGYLQRLAVDPAFRRRGVARDLVVDALTWMEASGFERALVNTGTTNEPALGLYAGLGFHRLPGELTIAELRLPA